MRVDIKALGRSAKGERALVFVTLFSTYRYRQIFPFHCKKKRGPLLLVLTDIPNWFDGIEDLAKESAVCSGSDATIIAMGKEKQFKVTAQSKTPRKPVYACACCIVLLFLYTSVLCFVCRPASITSTPPLPTYPNLSFPSPPPSSYTAPLFASLFALCYISVRFECRNNVYLYVGPCWLCIINPFRHIYHKR